MRFGLNAGEPIAEDDDLFGLSVTLAARIGDSSRSPWAGVAAAHTASEWCHAVLGPRRADNY